MNMNKGRLIIAVHICFQFRAHTIGGPIKVTWWLLLMFLLFFSVTVSICNGSLIEHRKYAAWNMELTSPTKNIRYASDGERKQRCYRWYPRTFCSARLLCYRRSLLNVAYSHTRSIPYSYLTCRISMHWKCNNFRCACESWPNLAQPTVGMVAKRMPFQMHVKGDECYLRLICNGWVV